MSSIPRKPDEYTDAVRASPVRPPTYTTTVIASTDLDGAFSRAVDAQMLIKQGLLGRDYCSNIEVKVDKGSKTPVSYSLYLSRPNKEMRPKATHYILHAAPHTPHPTPYTLHPAPYTLYPSLYTLRPSPCTVHYAPDTMHRTPHRVTSLMRNSPSPLRPP